ncbi:hypothetical protein GFK26_12625 [Variovorax paradoxus]|uniref:Uncharacterized protein n=1 Tax=Variovorax paradoxus TaxID=34073 RepID=A0A5Q0M523_VARPD|nr:hypothetical protein [Variovorax paradoxus]QFZ83542.1 hypothetical protein GFK26_12625 [Variovorax paradoxus]
MDSARDRRTSHIIDAEQLWDMEVIEKDGFVCPGCAVDVFPASYLKDINKRRPYFKIGKGGAHAPGCGIAGFLSARASAVRRRGIARASGELPIPFPSRLVMDPMLETVTLAAPCLAKQSMAAKLRPPQPALPTGDPTYHGHTVSTLRPICRIFMEFPNDRKQLAIRIPGVAGRTYGTAFRQLGFTGIRAQPVPTGLFYAALSWDFATKGAGNEEWTLNAGAWPMGAKRPTALYRVRINWSGWTDLQRATLRHELQRARKEVVGKKGIREKAWLFFVGRQDRDDPGLFVVDRYPLISCRVGEMRRPKQHSAIGRSRWR